MLLLCIVHITDHTDQIIFTSVFHVSFFSVIPENFNEGDV